MFNLKFLKSLTDRRLNRLEDLEQQIATLEHARDEQMDINAQIRRDHEDAMRKSKHAHEDALRTARNDIERLHAQAKAADETLGHLLKIRDEKRDIELERKKVELVYQSDMRVAAVRTEYQQKIEEHLNGRIKDLGAMYAELLNRLPDINVALKGRIGNE